jgi:hypothetical protein
MTTKPMGVGRAIDAERTEIRELLHKRYSPEYHTVLIDSIHRHGNAKVVLFVVETSTYTHRRVGIIMNGSLDSDMIAAQN